MKFKMSVRKIAWSIGMGNGQDEQVARWSMSTREEKKGKKLGESCGGPGTSGGRECQQPRLRNY